MQRYRVNYPLLAGLVVGSVVVGSSSAPPRPSPDAAAADETAVVAVDARGSASLPAILGVFTASAAHHLRRSAPDQLGYMLGTLFVVGIFFIGTNFVTFMSETLQ